MARQPRFSAHDDLLDARPVATLDLHGMTSDAARAAVERFIRASGRSGKAVEIITGKGKGSSGGPVLRDLVRGMLRGSLAVHVRDGALAHHDGGWRVLLR